MDEAKWGSRFLGLAEYIAQWSKDPSTKVGAVIADGKRIVSVGFNGLPQGLADKAERLADRDIKYEMTIHAEINAILFAERSVAGCTVYTWPFGPCPRCAGVLIQSGVRKVVFPLGSASSSPYANTSRSEEMFREAGVVVWKHSEPPTSIEEHLTGPMGRPPKFEYLGDDQDNFRVKF